MLRGFSFLTGMEGARHESKPEVKWSREHAAKLGLPASFDARQTWPSCVHGVRD